MKKVHLLLFAIALVFFGVLLKIPHEKQSSMQGKVARLEDKATNFINQSATETTGARAQPIGVTSQNKKQEPICQGADSSNFKCYEKFYAGLVAAEGIPATFRDIKIRENENIYIKSQCHPLTHSIGRAAAGLFKDVRDAYAHGDSYCWSGYYHGILEEIIEKKGKGNTLKELNTICALIPGKDTYSFDYYNCVHGLGHGLMGTAGQNLFNALEMCDVLTGSWERSSCYGGAFMENVIIENKGGTTEYLKPSDPVYPCNAVGPNYKQVCYLMQTSYMLKVSGDNFKTVFDLCATVEDPYKPTCYQSLGRDASGHSSSNKESTKAMCELGDTFEQKSNCIIGAVKDFVSYYHSDVQAKELCAALETSLRDICYQTTKNYYSIF